MSSDSLPAATHNDDENAQVGMSIPVEFFPPFVQAAVEAIQVWDVAKDVRL